MERTAQETPTFEARVERLINASPEAVFDAFTSEAAQAEWFASPEDRLVSLVVDARVGGAWNAVIDHAGQQVSWEGTFTEVDRPHRFTADLMNIWPGERFASTFTVTCEDRGTQTLLTVVEVHASERHRDDALGGVPGMIDVIQRIAEAEMASR